MKRLAGAKPGDQAAEALANALNAYADGYEVRTEDNIVRASYFGKSGGWKIHNREWGKAGRISFPVLQYAAIILAGSEEAVTQEHYDAVRRAARENWQYDRSTRK